MRTIEDSPRDFYKAMFLNIHDRHPDMGTNEIAARLGKSVQWCAEIMYEALRDRITEDNAYLCESYT